MKTEINKTIDERLEQIENDVKQIKIMLKNILSNYAQSESTGENLLNVKDVSSFLKVDNNFIYSVAVKANCRLLRLGNPIGLKKKIF